MKIQIGTETNMPVKKLDPVFFRIFLDSSVLVSERVLIVENGSGFGGCLSSVKVPKFG